MFNPHLLNRKTVSCTVLLALILLWPLVSKALSGLFTDTDLDQAEPVEIASHIMSIDYANGILVVAENQVMIVDVVVGGQRVTSQVSDTEGEAIAFEELSIGQTVLVQGLKLVDGRVVGAKVQQQ